MTRSDIQVLIDALKDNNPNTAQMVRTALEAIADGVAQTGDVRELDVPTSYIDDNFDPTGLGKNQRVGWAICNGNNGTRNRGGRVGMQYNSSYSTLGAIGGYATHVLSINEMPSHNHNVTYQKQNAGGGGGQNTLDATTNLQFPSSNTGGGQAHNNMQPFIVSLFIMKL